MSLGFNTALTALTSARLALQTIGHNIANANTLGYSRQRVLLSATIPQSLRQGLAVGTGVGVDSVDQVFDPLITGRLRAQAHAVGHAGGQLDVYRDLEAALGEPSTTGLNARLSSFFSALGSLQTDPADGISRNNALQAAVSLAQTFRTVGSDLGEVVNSVDQAITYEVARVNSAIEGLYELNRSILSNGFGGEIPPDVRDRQNQLLSELSQSVDVRVTQEPTGQITVTSGGHILVNPNDFNEVRTLPRELTGESIKLRTGTSTVDFKPKTGRLSSLLELAPKTAAGGVATFDALAHGLIRAINHAHATGVPPAGGYTTTVALHPFRDVDLDGQVLNERLTDVGLPFEIDDGLLTVSVRDGSGNTRQTRIPIVASQTTVGGFVAALDAIDHVSASVDTTGQLRIVAEPGYQFDFSPRLNPTPDSAGTFGGPKPTIAASLTFPTPVTPGSQFFIAVDGSPPQPITFQASHFANPAAATAAEMAAAINAQITGASASVVGGRLVVQGNTAGPGGTLQLNGGPLITGQSQPVRVAVTGAYTGTGDQTYYIAPLTDGVIGQTPGLQAQVRLADGSVVGTLDVGLGYTPGATLKVKDGIEVSFSAGAVSATAAHFVAIEAVAESDEAGILVATGVNAIFDGHDAATIEVRAELLGNPDLLATGLGGGVSDGSNLSRLLATKDRRLESLGDRSVGSRFDLLVQETGASTQRAQVTLETQQLLLDQLESRRLAVSGVNIDEELLLMEQFQRSFEVASRFAQTISEVTATLMEIVG